MSFWMEKTLTEMTPHEWESLCDGCGRCCLEKLEDMDTGEISYTNVACRLLDLQSCKCSQYAERSRLIPDCITLTTHNVVALKWMPSTCAYRLLGEGRPLPEWHPLITGNPQSVFEAGISTKGRVVAEHQAGELEDHIVDWPA